MTAVAVTQRIGVVKRMIAACSLAAGSYARRRQDSYEHELRVLTVRERACVNLEQVQWTEGPLVVVDEPAPLHPPTSRETTLDAPCTPTYPPRRPFAGVAPINKPTPNHKTGPAPLERPDPMTNPIER